MIRLNAILGLLLCPFLPSTSAQNQNFVFQHISTKDGLASNKVNCMMQDKKGYYWIGTDNGLQRFDGKQFVDIPYGKGHRQVSSSSVLISNPILEDNEGNIWGQSKGFISVYYPLTNHLERIEINDDTLDSPASDIDFFCKDAWNNIWIVTKLNLYKYDHQSHKVRLWTNLFKQIDKERFNKIVYDKGRNSLWIAGGKELFQIDAIHKEILWKLSDQNNNSVDIVHQGTVSLFLDSKQNLWISNWHGSAYKYNTDNFEVVEYTLSLTQG